MIVNYSVREVGPKELASMTGLSPAMQRDWRRVGHITKEDAGWSSFTLQDVAQIALRKTLADSGLGAVVTKPIFESDELQAILASVTWWMIEADQWDVSAETANAIGAADVDRFRLVEQITGVASGAVSRLLIFTPASGTVVLQNEGFTVDDFRPGVVQVVVQLDDLGQRAARLAQRALVTVEGLVA